MQSIPQVAIGLNHRGNLKETLKFMSDQGCLYKLITSYKTYLTR